MIAHAPHRNGFGRLSPAEALRALYIDFEGGEDQGPVLLGVHRRGRGSKPFVDWLVVDPAFGGLGCRVLTLRDAVSNTVRRAEHGDRRIVSWSEHDLRVVRTLRDDDPELVTRFEARYANARAFAEYWRNKLYDRVKPEKGRLADYLGLIEYRVPGEAEAGHVGETIRLLRPRLERGLPPTARQRERWVQLLEHNRHDCVGMRRVCLRATRELATADACGTEHRDRASGRGDAGRAAPSLIDAGRAAREVPSATPSAAFRTASSTASS